MLTNAGIGKMTDGPVVAIVIFLKLIATSLVDTHQNMTNGLIKNFGSSYFTKTLEHDFVEGKMLKVGKRIEDYEKKNISEHSNKGCVNGDKLTKFKKMKNVLFQKSKNLCCFIDYLNKKKIFLMGNSHVEIKCLTPRKQGIRKSSHGRKTVRVVFKKAMKSSNHIDRNTVNCTALNKRDSNLIHTKPPHLFELLSSTLESFINGAYVPRRSPLRFKGLIENPFLKRRIYLFRLNLVFTKSWEENKKRTKRKCFILATSFVSGRFKKLLKNLILSLKKQFRTSQRVHSHKPTLILKCSDNHRHLKLANKNTGQPSTNMPTYCESISSTHPDCIVWATSKSLTNCAHQIRNSYRRVCVITPSHDKKKFHHVVLFSRTPLQHFCNETFREVTTKIYFNKINTFNLPQFKSSSRMRYFAGTTFLECMKRPMNSYFYVLGNLIYSLSQPTSMKTFGKILSKNICRCKFNKAEKEAVIPCDLKMTDKISENDKKTVNERINFSKLFSNVAINITNELNLLKSNSNEKRIKRELNEHLNKNIQISKALKAKNMAIKREIKFITTNDNINRHESAKVTENYVGDGSDQMYELLMKSNTNITILEQKIKNDTHNEKTNNLECQKSGVEDEEEEEEYEDDEQYKATGAESSKVIIIVTYSTAFVLGCVGNLLFIKVLFFILKNRHKISKGSQSSMLACSRYLLNLSVSDLLLVSTLPIVCYVIHETNWPFYSLGCKFFYGARETNKLVSVYTLVALSFDRYVASFREAARYRTPKIGVIVCVTLWIVSIALTFPYWFYADVVVLTKKDSKDQCLVNQPSLAFKKHFEPYLKLCFPDDSNFYNEQFFSFTNEIRDFPKSLVSHPQTTNKTSDIEQVTCRMFKILIQKLNSVKNITKIVKNRPREHKSVSHCRWLMSDYSLFIITSIHFALGFCVPFVLIVFIYIALAIRLRHILKTPTFKRSMVHEPTMSIEGYNNTTAANFRGLRKRPSVAMTRIALVVSLAFLFTQLPYYIMELVHAQQSVSYAKSREKVANSMLIYHSVKDTVCQRVFLKHYLNLKVKANIVVVRCVFESYLRELKSNDANESYKYDQVNDTDAFESNKNPHQRFFNGRIVKNFENNNFESRKMDDDVRPHPSHPPHTANKKRKYAQRHAKHVSKKDVDKTAAKSFKRRKVSRRHKSKRIEFHDEQISLPRIFSTQNQHADVIVTSLNSKHLPSQRTCINPHKQTTFEKENIKNKKINDRSIEEMCVKDPIGTVMPKKDFKLLVVFSALAKVFEYFSCTFNPIIYGFMNKNFREFENYFKMFFNETLSTLIVLNKSIMTATMFCLSVTFPKWREVLNFFKSFFLNICIVLSLRV